MHYAVFLFEAHKSPYSQVVDINLPGSYFLEFLAMKAFGPGPVGLRLYDACLGAIGCGAMVAMSRPSFRSRWFGFSAGIFLMLVHLQDGLAQAGQRDFAAAVLVLGACSFLLQAGRRNSLLGIFLFELTAGFVATVKPPLAVAAALPFLALAPRWRETGRWEQFRRIAWAGFGFALPVAMEAAWLWHLHSLQAFQSVIGGIAVLHGEMARRSIGYLLSHCVSPVAILLLPWSVLCMLDRPRWDERRKLCVLAATVGLFSYVVQGKGYPYQRYLLLAALFCCIAIDLDAALASRKTRVLAVATCCAICLWFAPIFTRDTLSYSPDAPFERSLAADLQATGLNGGVQCLDTFGGCINTLYDLRAVQSTGFLYDCYLFGPPGAARDAYRNDFLSALTADKPRVVVMTSQDCFSGGSHYERVQRWPALADVLDKQYRVERNWTASEPQHWWHRLEYPNGYRIFIRRSSNQQDTNVP